MHFKRVLGGIVIGAAVLSLVGCAAIIHGSKQTVRFQTSPPGAIVEVVDALGTSYGTCETPCALDLKRKKEYRVTLTKSGYSSAVVTIDRSTDGWIWGNILLGGVIGLIVDFTSGAAYKLSPDELTMTLSPVTRGIYTPNNFDQGLVIIDYDKLSPGEKEKLGALKPIPFSEL